MSNLLFEASPVLEAEEHPVIERSPASDLQLNTTAAAEPTPASTLQSAAANRPTVIQRHGQSRIQKSSKMPRPQTSTFRRPNDPSRVSKSRNRKMSHDSYRNYPASSQHARQLSGSVQSTAGMSSFQDTASVPGMMDPYGSQAQLNYAPYGSPTFNQQGPESSVMAMGYPIQSEGELQKQKRKDQNRLAQKNFRIRNSNKIKDLESKLDEVAGELQQTKNENASLKSEKDKLEDEIRKLREDNYRIRASQESSPVPSDDQYGWSGSSAF